MSHTEYNGCELPDDLFYDLDYVWVRPEDDGTFTLGITDPAQTMAGRVQYFRFRKPGSFAPRRGQAGGAAGVRQVGGGHPYAVRRHH